MQTTQIKEKLDSAKKRLELYYKREAEMLDGGVQSYGLGTRSVTRYNTDLTQIRSAISDLKKEIASLEAQLAGGKARKAVGVVPRDW